MEMINIKINGMPLSVAKGTTILEAAKSAGIKIPTLCFLKDINEIGACRMCVAEVKGARSLVAACVYPIDREGTEIFTNTKKIQDSRRHTLELILSNHRKECLSCKRSGNCELQQMCRDFGVENEDKYKGEMKKAEIDDSAPHLIRDNSKCVLCRRCVAVCKSNQYVGVIGTNNRGFDSEIGCAFNKNLNETSCINCGQCTAVCPTGALVERDNTAEVFDALADPDKIVIVNPAPSIRATLGECFGMPIGTDVEGKMVTALRMLGFDKVFDTDFGADLTIMEEANEFIDRVQNGGVLPMITSCSPGWVKFCEYYYPDMIPNLSTCKSPQQMTGAMIKTYYAEKEGIDPQDIVVVSVMPCTAKKFEITRDDQSAAGIPDTDYSITTRELARMIERQQIQFRDLPDGEFDTVLGISTGASVIFGATGGVMEAALRTAADTLTGKSLDAVEYTEVRGTDDIKEATYNIAGMDVNVAVASGLSNAAKLLDKVKSGEANYHFIEIMCCPGGCVNGGGQPIQSGDTHNFVDLKALRASALYKNDENKAFRKSHDNPAIKTVYEEYLEKPGSHKAHEILHTSYVKRNKY